MTDIDPQTVEKVVTKTVNDNGQVYLGRELGGENVKVAVWITEET